MAATAAMLAIGTYTAIESNQQKQKAKGDAAKALRDQAANDPTKDAPNLLTDAAAAGAQGAQGGAAQRRRTLGASGRSDTILTGPRGVTELAPSNRSTLLGF